MGWDSAHHVLMKPRIIIVALVMLLGVAGPAVAGPFEDSYLAHKRGDFAAALSISRPFAEQGLAAAQFFLGYMYSRGEGVPQDYAEAANWYRRAADQGDPIAQYNLGLAYFRGEGVSQDYVRAHLWLDLTTSRLPPSARGLRASAVKGRDEIAGLMTPVQLAEAQHLAREWQPKIESH